MREQNRSTRVDLFHIGPPKTATTWLFHCLREHPQIRTSKRDTVHFFDIHYVKGFDWYHEQFTEGNGEVLFDPTYSYVCSPKALDRIYEYNPDAKLIVCIRNPIERAYSHYWHLRRTFHDLPFSDLLRNYNSFSTWVEHGFVADNINKARRLFGNDQVHILFFEGLQSDPSKTLKSVYEFARIASDFQSDSTRSIINPARSSGSLLARATSRLHATLSPKLQNTALIRFLENRITGLDEYREGIPPELHQSLCELCREEILAMSDLTGRDLSGWLQPKHDQQ